ncbi:MAG: hypothetical protein V4635_01545 [Bacteroidota bacterium]
MKIKLFLLSICLTNLTYSQTGKYGVAIRLSGFECSFSDTLEKYAAPAFKIMNEIFNSDQFRDSIKKITFAATNKWKNKTAIPGTEVLAELDKHKNDEWKLIMKEKSGALGETVPGDDKTKAYLENILYDMCRADDPCKFPFEYALAVNLCHEFMHHIGYVHHKNPKDTTPIPSNPYNCKDVFYDPSVYPKDIAYRTGWIVYDIFVVRFATKK